MIVNRYGRDMHVTVRHHLMRSVDLRLYRYTEPAVQTATGKMFDPSGKIGATAGGTFSLAIPSQSFALLTELTPDTETPQQ